MIITSYSKIHSIQGDTPTVLNNKLLKISGTLHHFKSITSNPKLSNSFCSLEFSFFTHHTKTCLGLEDATYANLAASEVLSPIQ